MLTLIKNPDTESLSCPCVLHGAAERRHCRLGISNPLHHGCFNVLNVSSHGTSREHALWVSQFLQRNDAGGLLSHEGILVDLLFDFFAELVQRHLGFVGRRRCRLGRRRVHPVAQEFEKLMPGQDCVDHLDHTGIVIQPKNLR